MSKHLTPVQITDYAEEFSRDPGFIKVEPNGRDRATYVYRALMLLAGYEECIEIANLGWNITEARLIPRLFELRAEGLAKTRCAAELGVSLDQINRWLT